MGNTGKKKSLLKENAYFQKYFSEVYFDTQKETSCHISKWLIQNSLVMSWGTKLCKKLVENKVFFNFSLI